MKKLRLTLIGLGIVLALSIYYWPSITSWVKAKNAQWAAEDAAKAAAEAQYKATHHLDCNEPWQTIKQVTPIAGSWGRQIGFTLFGDRGGTYNDYQDDPPPGLGQAWCFGQMVEVSNQ